MSLYVMSDSVAEDNGAILVHVVLSGELEVDITVSLNTRSGTGMYICKESLHTVTLICSLSLNVQLRRERTS